MSVSRHALIVRGGWEGHAPVQATDLFRPFLAQQDFAVRMEDSPAVYADARAMAETDLIVQCMTMSSIEQDQQYWVTSPAVWTRQWGRGRIFVATPGHTPDVLRHPTVRTIIERGLLWASR